MTRQIPVLFLEPTLEPGGAEHVLFNLITRLDGARFKPIVGCLKAPGAIGKALAAQGVPVYHDLLPSRFAVARLPSLVRLMRRHKVLVVHTTTQPLNTFWAVLAGRLAFVPVQVTTIHNTWGLGHSRRMSLVDRVVLPRIDTVVALAESHRQYLNERGVDPRKVEVISNGIDLSHFKRTTSLKRADLGLPDNVPVVGVVARLRPEKSHETFLRAAVITRAEVPATHFVLVGDGSERARLEKLTHTLGLEDQVHFLGQRDDVADVLPLLDVSVLPSRTEALPLAILESMAAGVPIVATNVGSVHELVSTGYNGVVVPRNDVGALATAMVGVLRDPDDARRMAENGRKRVEQYDVQRMVQQMEDLFERLLREKSELRSSPTMTTG